MQACQLTSRAGHLRGLDGGCGSHDFVGSETSKICLSFLFGVWHSTNVVSSRLHVLMVVGFRQIYYIFVVRFEPQWGIVLEPHVAKSTGRT